MDDNQILKIREGAYKKARQMGLQHSDAEDIAQDVCFRALNGGICFGVNLEAWGATCAKNRILDEKEKKKIKTVDIDDYVLENIEDKHSDNMRNERAGEIYDDAISVVSEKEKEVLEMFYLGLSHEEIRQKMHISVRYSRDLKSNAMKKIKNHINSKPTDFKWSVLK